jgi:hypothetical protein
MFNLRRFEKRACSSYTKGKRRGFFILAVLCAVSGEIAGRHKDDLPWLLIAKDTPDLALVLSWRKAHHALEFRTERSQAGIADFKADFSDRHFSAGKQVARVLHATASKEVMRRFAEGRVEQAMKVKWRETGFAGSGIEKNLRLKPFSQEITRTA